MSQLQAAYSTGSPGEASISLAVGVVWIASQRRAFHIPSRFHGGFSRVECYTWRGWILGFLAWSFINECTGLADDARRPGIHA